MGGQQSLVLAGLRPEKITGVMVCVPTQARSGSQLHGGFLRPLTMSTSAGILRPSPVEY